MTDEEEADWYTHLIECGWEEQNDQTWLLPGEIEWAMPFQAAVRAQMRREQWGV
jgi:hypothetical protein